MKKLVIALTLSLLLIGVYFYVDKKNARGTPSVAIGRMNDGQITFPIRKEIVPNSNMDRNTLGKLISKIDAPEESPLSTPEQPFFFTKPPKKIEKKLFKLSGIEKNEKFWVHFPGSEPIETEIKSLSGFKWRCGEDFYRLQGQIIVPKERTGKKLNLGGIGFGEEWRGEYVIITLNNPVIRENKVKSSFDINQNGVPEQLVGEHVREDIKLKVLENEKIIFQTSYGC